MCLEIFREAIQAGKPAPAEKNNDNGKKRKNGDCHPSLEKTNKKPKAPNQRVPRPPPSKLTNYTNLVSSREDVFMAIEKIGIFKRPDPLHGDHSKRNQNKYCWFHKNVGHTTEECITLKDEIEKLIRCGYLQDCIDNRRTRPQNSGPEAEPPHEIQMIFGRPHFAGEMRGAQERYIRETKERSLTNVHSVDKQPAKQFKGENDDITFKENDAHLVHHPHCDALVITAMMANNNVLRILVDNGSSVDILYYQAFQRMGLKNNHLKPSPNPIYDFTGTPSPPWGLLLFQ